MFDKSVRVLLVGADSDAYSLACEALDSIAGGDYALESAPTAAEGLVQAQSGDYDLILACYAPGSLICSDFRLSALAAGCSTPIICLAHGDDVAASRHALQAGVRDYLVRDRTDSSSLGRSMRYALEVERLSRALEEAREREAELRRKIQKSLLDGAPPVNLDGASISAASIPSGAFDGDFWEVLCYDADHFDLLIGDVMGKGLPAAVLALTVKMRYLESLRRLVHVLRPFCRLPNPEEIVSALRDSMKPELESSDAFVTLCCGRFDRTSGQMVFTDAGGMDIVHYSAPHGTLALLEGHAMPLGAAPDEVYAQKRVTLNVGDLVLLCSDGVTQAQNCHGELFGEQRLLEAARPLVGLPVADVAGGICNAVKTFVGDCPVTNDIMCLAVRIEDLAGQDLLAQTAMEVHSNTRELEALRKLIEWFCRDESGVGLTEYERSTLVLAVNEAAANILDHAYDASREGHVQVSLEAIPGEVRVDMADWGRPWEPSGVQPPAFDGSRDHGFGIFVIKNTVDEHRYYRDDLGRNHLLLIRRAQGRSGQ